jgi:hypothetical protein
VNRRSSYRDDEKAKKTARLQKARYRARTGSGSPQHQWTQAEELLVEAHEIPDRELALRLGVSVQAIHSKRWTLKK